MIEDVLNTNYEIVIGVVEPNQGDYASTNGKKKEVCSTNLQPMVICHYMIQ